MRKVGKYFLIFLASVLVLLGVLVLFTQTPMFKSWLRDKAVSKLQPYVNGRVAIGGLGGNLFGNIVLRDLSITQDDQPVIRVDRVQLRYSLLPLFSRHIVVGQFTLSHPDIHLVKYQDQTWNLSTLFKKSETPTPESSRLLPDIGWTINLENAQVQSGSLEIQGMDSTQMKLPQKIRDIRLDLGLKYANETVNLSLNDVSFETEDPQLKLETIRSKVHLTQQDLGVTDFELRTDSSQVTSNIEVENFDRPDLNLTLAGEPISLAELRRIMPNLTLYGNPRINIQLSGTLNALNLKLDLAIGQGLVSMGGTFDLQNQPYAYDIRSQFSKINLAEITRRPDLASDLNFTLDVKGRSFQWGQMNANFIAKMTTFKAMNYALNNSVIKGQIRDYTLTFSGRVATVGGSSTLSGNLTARPRTVPTYSLTGDIHNLNLEHFTSDTLLNSNLNFGFRVAGQGVDMNSLNTTLNLDFSASHVRDVNIDSARFNFSFKNRVFNIKELMLASPLARVTASGNLGLQKVGDIAFDAQFKDFSRLRHVLPLDSLRGQGTLTGHVQGALDSLTIDANLDLVQTGIETMEMREFKGELAGLISKKRRFLQFNGAIDDLTTPFADSLNSTFELTYNDSLLNYVIDLDQGKTFQVHTAGDLLMPSQGYKLVLRDLVVQGYSQTWRKVGPTTDITYMNSALDVSPLKITSDGESLMLSGRLGAEGQSRLKLSVDSLSIARNAKLLNPQTQEYQGFLNLDVQVSGTLQHPVINGDMKILNGKYYNINYQELSATVGYQNDKIDWELVLSRTRGDSLLKSSGNLPYQLSFSPFKTELLPDQPLELKLSTPGIDLSLIQGVMKGMQNVKGMLVADIVLDNTWNDLRGSGPIRFVNGQFDINELGTKYRDVNIALLLQGQAIVIKDFRMRSGKGDLKIVEGSLSLSKKQIEKFKARLKANNFEVVDNRNMEADIKGELELGGSIQSPKITGKLSVPAAEIRYQAFIQEETTVELTSTPFFVISQDTTQFDSSGAMRFQKSKTLRTETPFTETPLYKNLQMNLSLNFPRNTWLRSNEANIEVSGDLDLVKDQGGELLIFGSLSTVRGYYELQGNRFNIVEGEINFRGTPDYNPNLNIQAVYEFHQTGETQTQELKVDITGTKIAPQFQFFLNGQETDQKNVLSILLFGEPFDNLGVGQRNQMAQAGLEEKARGLITGQVMKQLTRKLGSELNLDVLEIESGENLGNTKVKVGKYITPDVFVSVSQDFGAQGEQTVELEWQIPRKILFFKNLFLQGLQESTGNTAADLLWKIEW